MDKYIFKGAAILTLLGLASLYYNYHVQVNLLAYDNWSHANATTLIMLPVFYLGVFWLLKSAISGELYSSLKQSSGTNNIFKEKSLLNTRLLTKLFVVILVYVALITFSWAAISDAQYLLNKNG